MISFERVRKLCLSLEEVEEKLSHGEPTFFVCKRVFVMYAANHHGDLWIGLRLDRTAKWETVRSIVTDAYNATRAKARRKRSSPSSRRRSARNPA